MHPGTKEVVITRVIHLRSIRKILDKKLPVRISNEALAEKAVLISPGSSDNIVPIEKKDPYEEAQEYQNIDGEL